jgi:hypothetical protein
MVVVNFCLCNRGIEINGLCDGLARIAGLQVRVIFCKEKKAASQESTLIDAA